MTFTSSNKDIVLRKAELADAEAISAAFQRSAADMAPWTFPPPNIERYISGQEVYLLCDKLTGNLIATFSISGIIRGLFQSAYLGYNAFTPYQGKGYMRDGMQLLLQEAFTNLNLHRLEANIQPENSRSINLVARTGFNKEGYSPRYLRVGGEWKDHERWAILNSAWRE